MNPNLQQIIKDLARYYGEPLAPVTTDPFELILWENIGYLISDQQRTKAFEKLRRTCGLKPHEILTASDDALLLVSKLGGAQPERRAARLREIALIAMNEFAGDLTAVLKLPRAESVKALRMFPGVGEPGAEKILLFTRSYPVLSLDSNGLRVLLRLGFGAEKRNYSASYRSVQVAIEDQLTGDYRWLIRAHLLLRQHGKSLCKTNRPRCEQCPVRTSCAFWRRQATD